MYTRQNVEVAKQKRSDGRGPGVVRYKLEINISY